MPGSPPSVQLEQIVNKGNSSVILNPPWQFLWIIFVFLFLFAPQSKCASPSHRTLHKGLQLVRHREAHQETPGFQRHPHIHVSFSCASFLQMKCKKKKEVIFLRSCLSDSHFPLTTRLTDTITAERQRTQLYLRQPSLQHQHPPLDHSCTTQTGWLTRRKQKPPAPQLLCRAPAPQGSPVSWGESVCFSTTCWHRRGRGWHATLSHILSDLAELILLLCC